MNLTSIRPSGYVLAFVLVLYFPSSSGEESDWHYGIGTGPQRLNVEGDQGFNFNPVGPVEFETDLDNDDIEDLAESAIGLGGFATNGTWTIEAAAGSIELGGDASVNVDPGTTISGEGFQDITVAEFSVGYTLQLDLPVALTPYAGLRYIEHDIGYEAQLTTPTGTSAIKNNRSTKWTDARLGLALDVPLSEKWIWGTKVEANFGDSDGTYQFNTGFTWLITQHWAARVFFNYMSIDFEENDPGDRDWYLYDAEEYGAGFNILYLW
ncbi:MAG: hypothetical protein ACR2P1_24410 [Pseudomonadales bacterium]